MAIQILLIQATVLPPPSPLPSQGKIKRRTETWASLAGADDVYYVGTNYSALYSFLENQTTTTPSGNLSSGSARLH
jgi:hypothetical protein